MNCAAYSQDTSSTRISNVNLRAAVKLIEGLRIDSLIQARDVAVLHERVTARDNIIQKLNDRILTYEALKTNYEKTVANQASQIKLSTGLNGSLIRTIKRERTKTVIVGIAGIIISGITLYLTTK